MVSIVSLQEEASCSPKWGKVQRGLSKARDPGSILGPLFSILFINDLPLYVNAKVDLYADDTTITASTDVASFSSLELSSNGSVDEIQEWADSNKLPINESKTKVLTVTGNSLASQTAQKLAISGNCAKTLDNVDSATLLGLEIDSTLSFHGHIDKICAKIASHLAKTGSIYGIICIDLLAL